MRARLGVAATILEMQADEPGRKPRRKPRNSYCRLGRAVIVSAEAHDRRDAALPSGGASLGRQHAVCDIDEVLQALSTRYLYLGTPNHEAKVGRIRRTYIA